MNIKKTLSIIIAFVISFVAIQPINNNTNILTASAELILATDIYATPTLVYDGELTYEVYSDHAELKSCGKDAEGEIIIPKTINNVPVTIIKVQAFSSCEKITSITIPDSVVSIGESAFYNCKKLSSVIIPDSVTTIGANAFNKTLLLMNLQDDNPLVIIDHILIDGKGCKGYVEIPKNVKVIGDSAFAKCDEIISVTIPETVVSIGANAFYECKNVSTIKIPESVTKIGANAFSGTQWFNKLTEKGAVIINHILIYVKPDLETFEIPNDVKVIGDGAFCNNSSLKSLIIPDSVTSIGDSAFSNSSLTSITLPESVKSIGDRAFFGCKNLKRATIANKDCIIHGLYHTFSVDYAMAKSTPEGMCYDVKFFGVIEGRASSTAQAYAQKYKFNFSVISDEDFTDIIEDNIKYRIFSDHVEVVGCDETPKAPYIRDNINGIPVTIIRYLDSSPISKIILPNTIEYIEDKAFYNCRSLGSITITNKKCKIYDSSLTICNTDYNTFNEGRKGSFEGKIYCYDDSTAKDYAQKYGFNYEVLKDDSFYDKIENSIIYRIYSDYAEIISYTTDLEGEIIIPETIDNVPVTNIDKGAFSQCNKVTNIKLSKNIIDIGDFAFSECTNLNNITLNNELKCISNSLFKGCSNLASITIPNSVSSIDASAFYNCKNLSSIIIPNSVLSIGESTFYGCKKLSSITIPNSVLSIGKSAFEDCANLQTIKILNKDCEIYDSPGTICNSTEYVDAIGNKHGSFKGTIYGYKGSTAKEYAFFNDYKFEELPEASETTTTALASTTTIKTTTTITSSSTTSISALKLSFTRMTLTINTQYKIPQNMVNRTDIVYSTNDTNIVTVSSDGVLNAVGEGLAEITVTDSSSNVAKFKVFVKAVTTTSTIASTTTTTSTTMTAPVQSQPKYPLGDVNNDGHINAVDASTVLTYYAMISTNKDGGFDDNQMAAADVNHDGLINAVDASCILSYYAYVSTTREDVLSLEAYLTK